MVRRALGDPIDVDTALPQSEEGEIKFDSKVLTITHIPSGDVFNDIGVLFWRVESLEMTKTTNVGECLYWNKSW